MFNGVLFVLHPIVMGILAQQKYRKTGILWALLTLSLDVVAGLFNDSVMSSPGFSDQIHGGTAETVQLATTLAFAILTFGVVTAVVWGILATLPKPQART
jgi:hypothetical protein